MVTHIQLQNTVLEEALQDRQVEDMEELAGEEVVHLTTLDHQWVVDEEGKRLSY